MAQGQVSRATPAENRSSRDLAGRRADDLEQYERILRFRDTVLSGNHPTIKLPAGVKAVSHPISSQTRTSSESGVEGAVLKIPNSVSTNTEASVVSQGLVDDGATGSQLPKPYSSGRIEINPIFLEKSDNLIRAELQIQRQRLEDSLRDEVEQRRVAKQVQAESLLDFDLSDILAKALTLVQATTIPPFTIDEGLTANTEAASDSFDDNTFYSSQHDTPDSNLTSRIRKVSEEAQVPQAAKLQQTTMQNDVSTHTHPSLPLQNHRTTVSPRPSYQPQQSLLVNNAVHGPDRVMVPGLNNYFGAVSSATGLDQIASRKNNGPGESRNQVVDLRTQQRRDQYPDSQPPSPVIRNHDLVPVAPQPAKASALTVVNEQSPTINSGPATAVGTPAQVAALRNDPPAAPNSDSSSQGGRDAETKKGKRKKRKADRQVPEPDAGQYIKPEPRSPSPLTAPSYIRSTKRQRQVHGQPEEIGPGQPRYEQPQPSVPYEQHPSYQYRDQRVPLAYEGRAAYPQQGSGTTILGDPRYGREYVEERQVPSGDAYISQHLSPRAPAYQYASRDAPPPRAVSQVIVHDPYREPPRVYREPPAGTRMSVHPDDSSFAVPPKPPQARIVVDAYGREYIEPPLPPARQSAGPPARPGDAEIIYERVPSRAMTGYPGPGPYDDGNIVYARPPPTYAVSRRYVTQPEYSHDYRDSQHHDHNSQPVGSGDFIHVMAPQDRRVADERPREYLSRASSIRPPEPPRYEAPYSYGRPHSVRPDPPGREYGGHVYAEGHRVEGPPYAGGYATGGAGAAPISQPYIRREQPVERYHDPAPVVRGSDEIAFIERPRGATQEIVYVDDARREVYR